jgi:long-subunit acyl-CoA synthetase (AMP-forming)
MGKSFVRLIEESVKQNWDLPAFSDYKGTTIHYHDLARKIEKIHIIFQKIGIKQGDKIALIGRNSSHWAVAFLAIVTYGAVVVPILPDFDSADRDEIKTTDLEDIIMEENRIEVNKILPSFSQIARVKLYPEEFEKTPKRSIKRYLYQPPINVEYNK